MNLLRKCSQKFNERESEIVNSIMRKIIDLIMSGKIETSEKGLIDFSQVLIGCYYPRRRGIGRSGLEIILSRILFWWSGEPLDSVDNFFGKNFRRRLNGAEGSFPNGMIQGGHKIFGVFHANFTPQGKAGEVSAVGGKISVN